MKKEKGRDLKMKNLDEMKNRLMKDERFAVAYNRRKPLSDFISDMFILRKRNGWTRKKLAEQMKTKVSNISRIESGKQNISFATMQKISEILGGNLLITMRKDDFVELSERSKVILEKLSKSGEGDPALIIEKSLQYKYMYDDTQPTSMNTINYDNTANDNTNDILDKIKLGSIENVLYQLHEDEWHSKEDILKFIKDNNLTDILLDAPEYIREVFGDDIKLVLELQDDPEEDWEELWIIIKYNCNPQEEIELELKLLDSWWRKIKDKVRNKLNFMIEPL